MIKKIFILVCLNLAACTPRGYWNNHGIYRAKKPNYKLSKEVFVKSVLIDTNFIYLAQDSLVTANGSTLKSGIVFHGSGKAFLSSYNFAKESAQNRTLNTQKKVQQFGLYRVKGKFIRFERFIAYDYGQYVIWEGEINRDTIRFFYKNFPNKTQEYVFVKSLPRG